MIIIVIIEKRVIPIVRIGILLVKVIIVLISIITMIVSNTSNNGNSFNLNSNGKANCSQMKGC